MKAPTDQELFQRELDLCRRDLKANHAAQDHLDMLARRLGRSIMALKRAAHREGIELK